MSDLPLALWVVPVADIGGVARHVLDATRVGIPGWRIAVMCPEGALATQLRSQSANVITGQFGTEAGLKFSRRTLTRVVDSHNPEIVHSHLAYADIISALSPLPKHVRRFTTEHGIAGDESIYHRSRAKAKIMSLAHSLRFSRFHGVIAVSEATKRAMIRNWKVRKDIQVIYNGVDTPLAATQSQSSPANIHILSLARLSPEKRIAELVDAFSLVHEVRPDAVLTIAGEGPLQHELESQAHRLGLGNAVAFPGFVDAQEALARATIVVQLSKWENCSYTLLDAVAAGKKVLATKVGGNPEILGPESLIEDLTPQSISRAILEAVNVPLRSRIDVDSVESMCTAIGAAYGCAATQEL